MEKAGSLLLSRRLTLSEVGRKQNFCWQDRRVVRVINSFYNNDKSARTAKVIYGALTFFAYTTERVVSVSYKRVSVEARASQSTVKRYIYDFAQIGLLSKQNKSSKMSVCKWKILDYSPLMQAKAAMVKTQRQVRHSEPTTSSLLQATNKNSENIKETII